MVVCCTLLLLVTQIAPVRDAKAMGAEVIATGWLTLDDVSFVGETATLQPPSEQVLEQLAALLKKHDEWRFEVQAHAEADGDRPARLALADRRARVVVTWLTTRGIPATRLVPKAYAEPDADRRPRLLLRKLNEE
jgi:outer membrane protein OmpA-like peptidoglycan-associated protein